MKKTILCTALVLAQLLVWPALAQFAPNWQLTDGLLVHPDFRGSVPKRSDVVFSTRSKRDDAVDAIKAFGATRVEWVYTNDKAFAQSVRDVAGWFGGSLNATLGYHPVDGRALDFDGNPIIPPFMKSWGAKIITTTDENTRRTLAALVQNYASFGARSIQFDDPFLQWGSAIRGGDFSASSLRGFRDYLSAYPAQAGLKKLGIADPKTFDYKQFLTEMYGIRDNAMYLEKYRSNSLPITPIWRAYLKETVLDYFDGLRSLLKNQATPMALSMNLDVLDRPSQSNGHFEFVKYIDYSMPETPIDRGVPDQVMRATMYRAMGAGYVPSLRPVDKLRNRNFIALSYALGANPIVPWDIYEYRGDDKPPTRYFGTPEEYADLYRLVRMHPSLFDGHEAAPVIVLVVPVNKYLEKESMQLVTRLIENNVPFALMLSGRKDMHFSLSQKRLRAAHKWVVVNPLSDFETGDRQILTSSSSNQVAPEALTPAELKKMAIANSQGGSRKLLFFPRAQVTAGKVSVVIHVIDQGITNASQLTNCENSIKINRTYLRAQEPKNVSVVVLEAGKPSAPVASSGGDVIKIKCSTWAILSLQY